MNKDIRFYEQRNEVLFVLNAADVYLKKPLTRIEVQKIIYLSNTLSLLKDFIMDYFDFKVWYNGPYSKDIQRTLNNLVGQRYIKMTYYRVETKGNDKNEKTKYVIEESGKKVVEELLCFDTKKEDYEWIVSIIRLVNHYGIENLVRIVYEEPTFKELKKSNDNFGASLNIYDENRNKLIKVARELQRIGKQDFGYSLDKPGDILLAIFDYLYAEID